MEARDIIARCLPRLVPADRRLLLLCYADGLTYREISKVLGVSESTVCLRHARLIKQLRLLTGACA
jgi:RNA polymerase sigma factor (sigma-70 family)